MSEAKMLLHCGEVCIGADERTSAIGHFRCVILRRIKTGTLQCTTDRAYGKEGMRRHRAWTEALTTRKAPQVLVSERGRSPEAGR